MYLTHTSRMMEYRRDGYEEGLHTGREEGISIGLEQGLERGAYENKLKTAKKVTFYGIIPRTSCPRNWASAGNGAEIGAN